jgi:hypothetical protein
VGYLLKGFVEGVRTGLTWGKLATNILLLLLVLLHVYLILVNDLPTLPRQII